jgi:hypothetical protein
VAGCCEYGDEPSGSGSTELVFCLYFVYEFRMILRINSDNFLKDH